MGSYLRAARRRRRVSIERAAEDTKIRADFLMRMESDEFDFLAAAYVRGFLRSYARYLRVDAEPLLAEFDRRFGFRADTAQIIAAQRRSPSRRSRGYALRRGLSSWQMAGMVAALILVTLAIIGLRTPQEDESRARGDRVAGNETNETTPSPEPSESPSPTQSPSPSPTPTDEGVIAFEDGIEVTVDAVRGDCWVDITSDGETIFSQTMTLGTTETFSADEEMTLILGLPESVDVIVNGTNLGRPGGNDPVTIKLPDDVESL
jgi:cytoskeleton protein RodZ